MSKHVKDLVTKDIARRLDGVSDALLVNVVGLDSNKTVVLRRQLRQKNIRLLMVKNSLAKRATEGTPLAAAFQGAEGTLAMVWGAEDFIALAKEITRLDASKEFPEFKTRGGVLDGECLTPERVKQISKWPSRQEQLSLLLGQILSPGANLVAALLGPGSSLASQIKEKSEGAEPEAATPEAASPETAAPEAASPETVTPEAASPEAASPQTPSPEAGT
jgi:ribosomal protein L10